MVPQDGTNVQSPYESKVNKYQKVRGSKDFKGLYKVRVASKGEIPSRCTSHTELR